MIHKATIADIRELHRFLVEAAKEGEILPRPLNDLYQYIRDYWIYRPRKGAPIKATTALHICWEDLAEIRNLFVMHEIRGKGLGEELVSLCVEEAKTLGVGRVFALTYRIGFFTGLGFKEADKGGLPNKVWVDCLQCMKFPDCDEEAVILDLKHDRFKRRKKSLKRA
jgi:amino-acid N-acetyltransferase